MGLYWQPSFSMYCFYYQCHQKLAVTTVKLTRQTMHGSSSRSKCKYVSNSILLHVFFLSSESVKYYHGEAYKYMIKSPTDLGKVKFCFCVLYCFLSMFLQQITVVQIHWIYDDEMKLFDLSRICLMFLCSKHLYTNTVTVKRVAVEKG